MKHTSISRREFVKRVTAVPPVFCVAVINGSSVGKFPPISVGYSTISWPEGECEHALDIISSLGFQGVQFVGWAREHYANRLDELRARLKSLKVAPVAQSCWGVKLDPANQAENSIVMRAYARFFADLGGSALQVTDSGKPDGLYSAEQIQQLGSAMNGLGVIARDHGLQLGYHPHVGSYGETEDGVKRILGATDERLVKLIADTGHLALGGMDPSKIIREFRDRLLMIHLKDVRRDALAAAQEHRAALRGRKYLFCEIGKGALDLSGILKTLSAIRFQGWAIVELDGNEPSSGGPDDGARTNREGLRCLGWEPRT